MSMQEPKATVEPQYNRACDACRYHKTRCLPQDSPDLKICQRCARTDRLCIFTAPQKRKSRKKTDTRVAELEREVKAMRALFEERNGKNTAAAPQQQARQRDVSVEISAYPQDILDCYPGSIREQLQDGHGFSAAPSLYMASPNADPVQVRELDVIDRGIVSEELASQLFNVFIDDLVPQCPTVVFPPGTTAEDLRWTKPTLFLSMITAAAGKLDSSLHGTLSSEVLAAYTNRTVFKYEKSLELVQALTVQTTWYCSMGKYANLKFYENIHAAASMAMDIGLGTNPEVKRGRQVELKDDIPLNQDLLSVQDDLEKKRTYATCYLLTVGVSMNMRRPPMLRTNGWLFKCIDDLSTSPHRLSTDESFCKWVRLLIITEDIYTSFSYDDENNSANLSQIRVQFMLKNFVKRLDDWKKDLTANSEDFLWLAYYHTNIFAHEIAIHDEHPPEELRPPFRITKILAIDNQKTLSTMHVDSIAVIISSSHAMIDILLEMELDTLRSLPILIFVRLGYACIMLTKIYTSCHSPDGQITLVVDPASLKLGFYLRALVDKLTEGIGPMGSRAPAIFLGLIARLLGWYTRQENGERVIETEFSGCNETATLVAAYSDGDNMCVTNPDIAGITNLMSDMPSACDLPNPTSSMNIQNSQNASAPVSGAVEQRAYPSGQTPLKLDETPYNETQGYTDMNFTDPDPFYEDFNIFGYDPNVWKTEPDHNLPSF